jgi:hypothetical protein
MNAKIADENAEAEPMFYNVFGRFIAKEILVYLSLLITRLYHGCTICQGQKECVAADPRIR